MILLMSLWVVQPSERGKLSDGNTSDKLAGPRRFAFTTQTCGGTSSSKRRATPAHSEWLPSTSSIPQFAREEILRLLQYFTLLRSLLRPQASSLQES